MWSEPLDDDKSSDGVSTESDKESIYEDMDFLVDTQDSEDDEDEGTKSSHKVIPVVTKQVNDVASRTLQQNLQESSRFTKQTFLCGMATQRGA
jgi:hypothetical protein